MAIKPGFIPERPYEPEPGPTGPGPAGPSISPEEDPMRQPAEVPSTTPEGPMISPGSVPGPMAPTGPANPIA